MKLLSFFFDEFFSEKTIRYVPMWHILLMLLVLSSALGMVYVKHKSRALFIELQALQQQRDDYRVEWTQLLLEQSVWDADVLIDKVARQELQMTTPAPQSIIMVKP